mmetsp:Transcript_12249/g.37757  ORF Transcript_12249/g.37757 Transcript_12249/m.37757 type:complete len:222 (+) Transcript_12249:280-945(+)
MAVQRAQGEPLAVVCLEVLRVDPGSGAGVVEALLVALAVIQCRRAVAECLFVGRSALLLKRLGVEVHREWVIARAEGGVAALLHRARQDGRGPALPRSSRRRHRRRGRVRCAVGGRALGRRGHGRNVRHGCLRRAGASAPAALQFAQHLLHLLIAWFELQPRLERGDRLSSLAQRLLRHGRAVVTLDVVGLHLHHARRVRQRRLPPPQLRVARCAVAQHRV